MSRSVQSVSKLGTANISITFFKAFIFAVVEESTAHEAGSVHPIGNEWLLSYHDL